MKYESITAAVSSLGLYGGNSKNFSDFETIGLMINKKLPFAMVIDSHVVAPMYMKNYEMKEEVLLFNLHKSSDTYNYWCLRTL